MTRSPDTAVFRPDSRRNVAIVLVMGFGGSWMLLAADELPVKLSGLMFVVFMPFAAVLLVTTRVTIQPGLVSVRRFWRHSTFTDEQAFVRLREQPIGLFSNRIQMLSV